MNEQKVNHFKRLLLYFGGGFLFLFVLIFLVLISFYPVKLTLVIASIFGFMYGLFTMGFMTRSLKREHLEIVPSKLGQNQGLEFYKSLILDHMSDLRYILTEESPNRVVFSPRTLYRIFETNVIIEWDQYQINVTASRLMIRMLRDLIK
jgi:hypothetical protein